jgi:hypothetical protein
MEQQVSLLRMQREVPNKVALAKSIIAVALCFNGMKLSDTETTVLAYFMVYGITANTKQLIIKSGVCKNIPNIKTIMVKLKKFELIYKDDLNSKVYITKALGGIELGAQAVGIYLKLNTARS